MNFKLKYVTRLDEISFIELRPDGEGYRREEVMFDTISVIAKFMSLKVGHSNLSFCYSIFPIFSLLIAICISKFSSIEDEDNTRL